MKTLFSKFVQSGAERVCAISVICSYVHFLEAGCGINYYSSALLYFEQLSKEKVISFIVHPKSAVESP